MVLVRKFLLSFFVVVSFIIYSISQRNNDIENSVITPSAQNQSGKNQTTPTPTNSSGNNPQPTNPPPSTNTQAPQSTITPVQSDKYKNGEYTGDIFDALYGNIQVKVVIDGGKITDVQFLDYPQDRKTSIEINTNAMPILKSEAISAQNANVDIVSGATATSEAFIQSLHSALNKAS